jgi:MFS family permease
MGLTIARRVRFARALGSRPFALLWLGQTVSALGDGAFFTALPWTVLLLTHSGTAMGLVGIAEMLPRVAFLLVGGVVADRLPRRLILLCSDAGRAVAVLAVAALAWAGALQLWHLVALGLLFGFADGFFMPAYNSIPPQLVPTDDLPSANALSSLGRQMSTLVGPALGAGFITFSGVQGAFAFDGLTFIFSALCLAAIRVPERLGVASAGAPTVGDAGAVEAAGGRGIRGVIADVREGLGYVTRSTWLWATIAIASIANMGWTGALFISAPKLVHDHFHAGVWLLGALQTSLAVGSILATLTVGNLHHLRHRGIVAYVGVACSSAALLALGLPFPLAAAPVIACLAGAVIGIGLGIFDPIWTTTLQQLVPADKLGRVSSIDWLGSLVATPLGMAVGGVLTDRVGPAWVFVGAGAINVALSLLGLSIRGIRELD